MSGFSYAVDEPVSEREFLQDFPVVLSASRLSQPVSEAPNAMTVIDRQMIKSSGFRNIAELFRLVPGMYVGNVGANTPIVSLNGVSDQYSRRMQVLVDGRSVYLPPFGGVDWQDLPLLIEDIERIEVVRGPAAASHGSNSFYGVINIITRDADSIKTKSVVMNRGEMGISDVSAFIGKAGESLDYRLSFGYRADGGDNPKVMNDTSANHLLNLRSNYRLNSANSFDLQLGLNNGVYGQGTAGRVTEAFRDVRTQNDFEQLSWLHALDGGDESKLTYYRINRDYVDPYKCNAMVLCASVTPSLGFTQDIAKIQRQELELQNTNHLGTNNRVVWGGGIRYDYVDQPLIFNTAKGIHQSRIFAHDEWRATEKTVLNAGAMYEDDGNGHRNASPRIALNHHLDPQNTFRASVSTATRNPVMAELYLQTAKQTYWSNGYTPAAVDIRPEKIISKEIGYLGQFGAFNLDGRIYYDKVRDIVLLDAVVNGNPYSPTYSFNNIYSATFKGIDISANYRWNSGKLTANYSYQQSGCSMSAYPTQYFNSTFVPPLGATIGQYLTQLYQNSYSNLCGQSVPTNSGNLLMNQQLTETLQYSIGLYLRGKVRIIDVSPNYPPESPMRRVDMRIAKAFGKKEKPGGGEIAVVLQNAFQDNYTGYGNVTQRVGLLFNRRAYITSTLNF